MKTDIARGVHPESTLEEVHVYLRALQTEVADRDALDRATAREQAVRDLEIVDVVSSPAKLVDAALNGSSPSNPKGDLQGSALVLQDPEQWPDPVNGGGLLEELTSTFTRYLALPEGGEEVLALWTMHTHAHGASSISPVLAITSPEKQCGKTTVLDVLSALVPRPLPTSNVTAATVFRAVERWQPTLLIDEADTFLQDGSELRGVLNSGHRRSLAFVIRTVGDDYEPRRFRTWSPKAIALIGKLPDTLQDRSVELRMRRRAPEEKVDRLRRDRMEELLHPLRRKAWTWAQDHLRELSDADPSMPSGMKDRERDNWRPLLAVADLAGGPWPERARVATRALQADEQDDGSLGTRLLSDVRKVLDKHPQDRIRSKELVKQLCNLEEAPWSEYKGKGLSPVSLSNVLDGFDISSKKFRFPAGVFRGYERDAFEDAFRRYLPPSGNPPGKVEQVEQSRSNMDPDGFLRWNNEADVPPSGLTERPYGTGDVPGVPPSERNPGEGGNPLSLESF